jgi:hypothetical protein
LLCRACNPDVSLKDGAKFRVPSQPGLPPPIRIVIYYCQARLPPVLYTL